MAHAVSSDVTSPAGMPDLTRKHEPGSPDALATYRWLGSPPDEECRYLGHSQYCEHTE